MSSRSIDDNTRESKSDGPAVAPGRKGTGSTYMDNLAEEELKADAGKDMTLQQSIKEGMGGTEGSGKQGGGNSSTSPTSAKKRGRKSQPPAASMVLPPAPTTPPGRTRSGLIPFASSIPLTGAEERALAAKQARAKKAKERRASGKKNSIQKL